MGEPIESSEIEKTISKMENNKTLGPDGLTKEFYSIFSKELIPVLKEVFSVIF